MKRIISFLICFQISVVFCHAQKIEATSINSVVFEADEFVGLDGFGHYFFLKNNVLYKNDGVKSLQYQNVSLGNIKKVDVINPLKVVVFYEEFNTVVLLDNQMNEIQKIVFSTNETPIIASAVGMSGQNQLWLYNSVDQQIGLFDLTNNQYKSLGVPIKENLMFYQTDFNYFHWIDTQNQWYSCSIFGRVENNGSLAFENRMQLLEKNKLLYAKENTLFFLDRDTNTHYKIVIFEKTFQQFYYKDQILSIFTNQGITNYKITLP